MLLSLSTQLQDYDSFMVGYMGYTIEEVVTSMYLSQDYKSCVLKMLSLWRCKDEICRVKTVKELLCALESVLQYGSYRALKAVIISKLNKFGTLLKIGIAIIYLIYNITKLPSLPVKPLFLCPLEEIE